MKLSIILATRGRPHLLIPTIETTRAHIHRTDTNLVIAVDHDDEPTIQCLAGIVDPQIVVSVMPREDTLGEKYNNRVPVAPADVYLVMVDYAPMATPGFDARILEAARVFPDGIGVIYGSKLPNLSFPEINAVTHGLVELMGGIYPPYFPYWFVDHWLDDIAKMIGRLAVADVVHNGSQRPGTMEMREPAFWASFYDDLAPLRRRQAEEIMAAPDFADEPWRKDMLRSGWALIEARGRMINGNVRASVQGTSLTHDARYARVKAQATALLRHLQRPAGRPSPARAAALAHGRGLLGTL